MAGDSRDIDDLQQVVMETQYIWEAKAAFWDAGMGEGNHFQTALVGPSAERLLDVQPGQEILDIACGNGVFARRLAALGANVVAADFSQTFLDLAASRTTEHADRIDYRLVDATSQQQIEQLGEWRFDSVVCNMAIMDMPTIEPLLAGVRTVLKPGGRFVFTIQHPAFNSNATRLAMEEDFSRGTVDYRRYLVVTDYLHVTPAKGPGMPGEPEPHWYFHRPLQQVFGSCFAAGFIIDGLEEPSFSTSHSGGAGPSWMGMPSIPPVIAVRVRLGNS